MKNKDNILVDNSSDTSYCVLTKCQELFLLLLTHSMLKGRENPTKSTYTSQSCEV